MERKKFDKPALFKSMPTSYNGEEREDAAFQELIDVSMEVAEILFAYGNGAVALLPEVGHCLFLCEFNEKLDIASIHYAEINAHVDPDEVVLVRDFCGNDEEDLKAFTGAMRKWLGKLNVDLVDPGFLPWRI